MKYRIETAPAAQRDLKKAFKKLSKKDAQAVSDAISNLEENPRPDDVSKLKGEESLYKLRVGNYRIIYQILDAEIIVILLKIADRKEAYKRLHKEVKARLKSLDK